MDWYRTATKKTTTLGRSGNWIVAKAAHLQMHRLAKLWRQFLLPMEWLTLAGQNN